MIVKILIAVLIFGITVIIHELGHFLLAKANGITVTEFSIGFSLFQGNSRIIRRIKLIIIQMGTNLIAETDHIVFLPGHGPGVMIYVPDQLFHFFPVPFPRLSVLVIRLSLGPDKRRHGKGLPFPVSQYFGGLQIIQNAVVGSSSPAQGTKASD